MMRYDRLPKNFFFIAIPKYFSNLLSLDKSQTLRLEYTGSNRALDMVIIASTEFLAMPYKEVKKLAKILLKDGKTKK